MAKISIIVPVYNVERYLAECIDSILNQTFQDLEILCIDDGSTDGSEEILERYAAMDQRIRIIRNTNHGYGYTMNCGIEHVTGDYIGIVESDDWIAPKMYEELFKAAREYRVDVVKSDYYTYYFTVEGKEREDYTKLTETDNFYNRVLKPEEEHNVFRLGKYTWTGLYRTAFIRENNIRHNETPGASYQDNGFWFQTLVHAQRMYFINQAFYHYRVDNPQASTKDKGRTYAVSEEFKFIREKLLEMGEKGKQYMGLCHYFWLMDSLTNIKRIAPELRVDLIRRVKEDYLIAVQNEELSAELFEDFWIKKLFLAIANPVRYCADYTSDYDNLMKRLTGYDKVIIYGAGIVGKRVYNKLKDCNVFNRIVCFAVTDRMGNENEFRGIPIREISELDVYRENTLVILAVSVTKYDELRQIITARGFGNYITAAEILH